MSELSGDAIDVDGKFQFFVAVFVRGAVCKLIARGAQTQDFVDTILDQLTNYVQGHVATLEVSETISRQLHSIVRLCNAMKFLLAPAGLFIGRLDENLASVAILSRVQDQDPTVKAFAVAVNAVDSYQQFLGVVTKAKAGLESLGESFSIWHDAVVELDETEPFASTCAAVETAVRNLHRVTFHFKDPLGSIYQGLVLSGAKEVIHISRELRAAGNLGKDDVQAVSRLVEEGSTVFPCDADFAEAQQSLAEVMQKATLGEKMVSFDEALTKVEKETFFGTDTCDVLGFNKLGGVTIPPESATYKRLVALCKGIIEQILQVGLNEEANQQLLHVLSGCKKLSVSSQIIDSASKIHKFVDIAILDEEILTLSCDRTTNWFTTGKSALDKMHGLLAESTTWKELDPNHSTDGDVAMSEMLEAARLVVEAAKKKIKTVEASKYELLYADLCEKNSFLSPVALGRSDGQSWCKDLKPKDQKNWTKLRKHAAVTLMKEEGLPTMGPKITELREASTAFIIFVLNVFGQGPTNLIHL